jgi:hypothetical protein
MITLMWIAAVIVVFVLLLLMRSARGSKPPVPGSVRFRHTGPGEVRPKGPRAPGLN